MGRSLMFFVSLPLLGFFSGVASAAINFEDSLVRVQKVTGMTNEALSQMKEGLRAWRLAQRPRTPLSRRSPL